MSPTTTCGSGSERVLAWHRAILPDLGGVHETAGWFILTILLTAVGFQTSTPMGRVDMGRPSGTGSRPGTEPSLASLRAESGVAAARPDLYRGFAWGPRLRRGEVRTKSRRGTSVSRSMSGVARMDQAPATGDREDGQPVPRHPSGRPRKAARTSNEPSTTSVPAPAPAPRQLPPAIHGFVGRAEHLAELTRMLDGHIDRSGTGPDDTYPGSAAILAIVGPAGVGNPHLG